MSDRKPLIPVRPEDMPLGKALPWTLYGRGGQLIAPAGYVLESAAQRARLIESAPMREAQGIDREEAGAFLRQLGEAADPNDPDAAMLASTGQRDALGRLRHNVDSIRLSYLLGGELEPRRASVPYIGRLPGQALIVGAPHLGPSRSWHALEGIDLDVRLMCGRGMYTFETRLIRFAATPGPHLFLAYPRVATFKEVRQSTRVPIKLPALVTIGDGPGLAAVMVNLSGHGCAVRTEYMLGEIGAAMTVSFRVSVHGQPHTICLPAVLRSQVAKGGAVIAGLQFDRAALERDWHLPLVLKSYVYERTLDT